MPIQQCYNRYGDPVRCPNVNHGMDPKLSSARRLAKLLENKEEHARWHNTLKRLLKTAIIAWVGTLVGIIVTWYWCWLGIALHQSRGGLTAGVTILGLAALIALTVAIGFVWTGVADARKHYLEANEVYNDAMDIAGNEKDS